ncbi:MAG: polysaccharide biosynthesis/export family protein [Flavobacteriales bacterium]
MWRLVTALGLGVLFVGCTVNQDLMFRTEADHVFDSLSDTQHEAYTLAPNDRLQLQLFSNRGQRLMAMTAGSAADNQGANLFQQQQRAMFTYRVELDGTVELPEVGAVMLAGLTLDEAERKIEAAYESEYVDPYALLQVVNNRVLVFPGEAGQATVITLQNQNTTVIEALAQAGGIRQRGRSRQIKLIRQRGEENLVYHMDLSTVDGLEAARTIVQANDIIYVESNPQVVREVLADVSPVAQLVTTFTSLWLTYQVLLTQD